MSLQETLRRLREVRGMTLDEVSKRVGVSRQTIQKYESGVIANIPLENIEKLAVAYGVPPARLMGWSDGAAEEEDEERAYILDIYASLNTEGRVELASYAKYLSSQERFCRRHPVYTVAAHGGGVWRFPPTEPAQEEGMAHEPDGESGRSPDR